MNRILITLQDAIDLLPDAVIVVNQDINIVAANLQVSTVFGYQPQELVNQQLNILIPERLRQRHDLHFRQYFEAPVKRRMGAEHDLFGLHKSGKEIDVDIALAPVTVRGQQMAMATIRDISPLQDLERSLLKKNEELSLMNTQLERVGYIIAHDLKSPLLNLHALVNLLTRELAGNTNEKIENYTKVLNDILRSMMNLITGVTEYSRVGLQDVAEEDVELSLIIHEVRKLIHFPPHFQVTVKGNLPVIKGNKTKILQVFLNLVNNAVKYNDKPVGIIEIQAVADEKECVISVSDNGPGVPAELRGQVFELFRKGSIQKDNSQGIGLAVVKKIVEDHGGEIRVEQSPLGGASFILTWPVQNTQSDPEIPSGN